MAKRNTFSAGRQGSASLCACTCVWSLYCTSPTWWLNTASCAGRNSSTNRLCPSCTFSSGISDLALLDLNKYTTYNCTGPDFMFSLHSIGNVRLLSKKKGKPKHNVVLPQNELSAVSSLTLITTDVWHYSDHNVCYFGNEALNHVIIRKACRNMHVVRSRAFIEIISSFNYIMVFCISHRLPPGCSCSLWQSNSKATLSLEEFSVLDIS